MQSLFSRLFLSFILITILTGVTTLLISKWTTMGPYGGLEKQLMSLRADDLAHLLSVTGRAAETLLARGGEEALLDYLRKAGSRGHDRLFLLHENYRPFSNRTPPKGAVELARTAQKFNDMQNRITRTEVMIAMPLHFGQSTMTLVGTTGRESRSPVFAAEKPKVRGFTPIFIMVLLAAPACYFLARSLTAPIRELRQATQRIAKGDFSARVDLFSSRSAEIVNLSRDFNVMAKRTQSLLKAQKRLLRDISHELRSPLTRLNVALELARQHPENIGPQLVRMEKEAFRFDELIAHLLTLAKKGSRLEDIPRQPVHLPQLLNEIILNAEFEASGKRRKITLTKCGDITVSGSSEMLSRALENIIRNGLHYTAPGTSIEILVSTHDDQVTISVRDYGPGVPQDQLTRIFKPFYRVTEARDRVSGGTGIGLAIAKQAVVMHGGSIAAKNAEHGGLIIEVALPLM